MIKQVVVLHETLKQSALKDIVTIGSGLAALTVNKLYLDYESFAFVVSLMMLLHVVAMAIRYERGSPHFFTKSQAVAYIERFYDE